MCETIIFSVIVVVIFVFFTILCGWPDYRRKRFCEKCRVRLTEENFGKDDYYWGTLEDGHTWYKVCKTCMEKEE